MKYTTNYNLKKPEGSDTVNIDDINVNMDSIDATLLANLLAAKGYTDTQIQALVNAAPGALNTLKELADALGDDPNFRTTILNAIAAKANQSDLTSHEADNTAHGVNTKVSKGGDTVTGPLYFTGAKPISIYNWGQISCGGDGYLLVGNNCYKDVNTNQLKFATTHASLGACGIMLAWGILYFFSVTGATTADQVFNPTFMPLMNAAGESQCKDIYTMAGTGSGGILHHMLEANGNLKIGLGLTGVEDSSNNGSDFGLWGYDNNGATIGRWLYVKRNNGEVQTAHNTLDDGNGNMSCQTLAAAGNITANGGKTLMQVLSGGVRIQSGKASATTASATGTIQSLGVITFPAAFTSQPVVLISMNQNAYAVSEIEANGISSSQFTPYVNNISPSTAINFSWIAIGN